MAVAITRATLELASPAATPRKRPTVARLWPITAYSWLEAKVLVLPFICSWAFFTGHARKLTLSSAA